MPLSASGAKRLLSGSKGIVFLLLAVAVIYLVSVGHVPGESGLTTLERVAIALMGATAVEDFAAKWRNGVKQKEPAA